MSDHSIEDPLLEMYLFENSQLIEQLEATILHNEETNAYPLSSVNEIFRVMHTIKGSSTMMQFDGLATLSHHLEDLFEFIRKENPELPDYSILSELVFSFIDYTKVEFHKIRNLAPADGDASNLIANVKRYLSELQQVHSASVEPEVNPHLYKAIIYFTEGCGMENVRAFQMVQQVKELTDSLWYLPEDIMQNHETSEIIIQDGFQLFMKTELEYVDLQSFLTQATGYLRQLELVKLENDPLDEQIEPNLHKPHQAVPPQEIKDAVASSLSSSFISINLEKLDGLMDLIGELVIAEAMVTQNPDLVGLKLDQFHKAATHLKKITSEIQDTAMSIRMVPLTGTFQKMQRVVRDMSKKLNKEVQLVMVGDDTEVDKNIIEHISDPMMHMVRNAIDHGIETREDRLTAGKPGIAKLTLEAKHEGSEVLIIVRDDGCGLNKEKILQRARQNEMIYKNEHDMTDREIFNLILLPGFSTKESITEFSGRGVGLDVVMKNIKTVGGSVSVDSVPQQGTSITVKIPLTLAIIDGMNIRVGTSRYTIPTTAIRESFKPDLKDVITDPSGQELIMVRGQCYPVLRLNERFMMRSDKIHLDEGILIMIEKDEKRLCLFADELLGQQQVVVKTLPQYMRNIRKIGGISGCTLLGDGSISLILDASKIVNEMK